MIIAQAAALFLGCILDLIFGDPDFGFHPIRLIGMLISAFERAARKIFPENKAGEITGGIITALFVIAISGAVPFCILFLCYRADILLGMAAETVICYFMLSAKSLKKSAGKVYSALLRVDIDDARKKVSMIVGRDTESLDDIGITKAAVETVAENTCDGVVAPLIYMAIGGGVLGCMYKAINTLDSMIGYRNEKYINFGKFAARLDDAVNFIPSRIAAYLMILAAFILGFDGRGAYRIHKRDSRKHKSPNSAQTESVCAGALRIQLAGDAYYFGKLYKKPFIGDALRDVKYENIPQSCRLMYVTAVLTAVIFIGAKFLAGFLI